MNFKLDNKLIKYLIIIIILFLLISKIPQDNLPGKNPFILTSIVILIVFLLDQPNVLFENFTETPPSIIGQTSGGMNETQILPSSEILKNAIKEAIAESNISNTILSNKELSTVKPSEVLPPVSTNTSNIVPINSISTKNDSVPFVSNTLNQFPVESIAANNVPVSDNVIMETLQKNQERSNPISNPEPSMNSSSMAPPSNPSMLSNIINEIKNKITKEDNVASPELLPNGLPSTNSIITNTIIDNKADACNCEDIADKAITKFLKNRRILDKNGMLHYADDYFGDMGYSQLRLDNYIPMGSGGDGVYASWDMSKYSVLNTNRWKPTDKNTSKCKTDVMPDPQPVDSKAPLNLMNWDFSRKIMPQDQINTEYINDRLNN